MLRLGNYEAAHPAALQFHIDYVGDSYGSNGTSEEKTDASLPVLRAQLLEVVQKLAKAKMDSCGVLLHPAAVMVKLLVLVLALHFLGLGLC
jgi:hypothetical protein